MKTVTVFMAALFVFVNIAAAQTIGVIRGKVSDEDNLPLAGANIFIKDHRLGTAADNNGRFTLLQVPSGTQQLSVSYIGYRTETLTVDVKPGETITLDIRLQSGVIIGDEIVVLGERLKGQAKSLNQQRSNPNITNIISSDQIGRFPDANIGDALKRIPAITVNYDQGEARFANIRGTEPRLNSIMINGERIPSAEGGRRAVQVDLIPADAIQAIEVNKAVTPDMDADAIGGSVNLVTRGAPDRLRLSATLGSGYNMLSEKAMWIGSAVAGTRVLDNKIGIMLSGSYHNHYLGSDNAEGVWSKDENDRIYVGEWDVRKYTVQRLRQSVSGAVDFRLDQSNTIFASGMYNHRNDWENRWRLRYRLSAPDENGISQSTEIRRQVKGGIDNDQTKNARLEDQRTWTMGLSGDHIIAGFLKANWSVSTSKASEERPNERYLQFRVRRIPVNMDLSNPETPYPSAVDAATVTLDKYSLHELTEEYQYVDEKDFNSRLDLQIPLIGTGNYKNSLKFGGRYKTKDKRRNNQFFEYTPLSGFENLAAVPNQDLSDENYLAGDYRIGHFATPEYLGSLDLDNPALFEKNDAPAEYAAENYSANEKVAAGYVQLNQNLGDRLHVIAGLRIEQTTVDYRGFEFNDDTEEIRSTTGLSDYSNVLPGIHFKYDLRENTILRLAWTNTLARPNYYDLVPYREIAVEDEELFLGNPDLDPTTSMNFDLMAEHYFASVGILSAGLFYKDIANFIYVHSESNYVDPVSGNAYRLFQARNGAKAELFGVEFSFQRQLDFLPGFLSRLGLYSNYTYTTSTTTNPDFGDREIELPGAAPHSLNASLIWQDSRLVAGLSFNYTSAYMDPDEMDLTPGLERYYDRVTYLDFTASYAITSQFRIFMEANNLLNQPLRYYAGIRDRTYQAEFYNRRFTAGVKFDL
jgi:TonB-dependent receptor